MSPAAADTSSPRRGSRRAQITGQLGGADHRMWVRTGDSNVALATSASYSIEHCPLTIRDAQRAVVARDGDEVTAVGGFLPDDDERVLADGSLFFASSIERAK